jgi:Fe-S oxidoreductase
MTLRKSGTILAFGTAIGFAVCAGAQQPRESGREALYHGHCHHKALFGTRASERALESVGVAAKVLDSGCCGMAGSFGFGHVDLSRRIGERVLLPAVRAAEPDRLIVAEGFSCREQIRQMTGRRALHLADVLAEALQPQ